MWKKPLWRVLKGVLRKGVGITRHSNAKSMLLVMLDDVNIGGGHWSREKPRHRVPREQTKSNENQGKK